MISHCQHSDKVINKNPVTFPEKDRHQRLTTNNKEKPSFHMKERKKREILRSLHRRCRPVICMPPPPRSKSSNLQLLSHRRTNNNTALRHAARQRLRLRVYLRAIIIVNLPRTIFRRLGSSGLYAGAATAGTIQRRGG